MEGRVSPRYFFRPLAHWRFWCFLDQGPRATWCGGKLSNSWRPDTTPSPTLKVRCGGVLSCDHVTQWVLVTLIMLTPDEVNPPINRRCSLLVGIQTTFGGGPWDAFINPGSTVGVSLFEGVLLCHSGTRGTAKRCASFIARLETTETLSIRIVYQSTPFAIGTYGVETCLGLIFGRKGRILGSK